MRLRISIITLFISVSASAAGLPCSIHPKKGLSDSELASLAKVTQADAQSAALMAVTLKDASKDLSVTSGELEAEGGCLIYSFDIKMLGKKSIIEVAVDAGTGKVLSQKSEGPKAQAAEAAADKTAAAKK